MPTSLRHIIHEFAGGWSANRGQHADVTIGRDGKVAIPFLTDADNVFYELDGGPHKTGGAELYNSVAIDSGNKIRGLYDYWVMGASATGVQYRLCHAGTKLIHVDADPTPDTHTDITNSNWSTTSTPHYNQFDNLLIVTSDDSADTPQSWNGSDGTTSNITTAPNFGFSVTHKLRVFAAGDIANPSTLYYSRAEDPLDWTGNGSGAISVDPGDGDKITAIASFRDELFIWKGPNKGSIHRLQGSTPLGLSTAGDGPFRMKSFARGIGAAGQHGLFQFGNDLGFVSPQGEINTLKGVDAFGDFRESNLSRDIDPWLQKNLARNRTQFIKTATDTQQGYVLFSVSTGGASENNTILMMDYRFGEPRWAKWSFLQGAKGCPSIATMVDPDDSLRHTVFVGGNDGFIRKLQQRRRLVDGTTDYTGDVKSPFLNYGDTFKKKKIAGASVTLRPVGTQPVVFGWRRDLKVEQTKTISQGGADPLGPVVPESDTFVLASDTGDSTFVEPPGETREHSVMGSGDTEDVMMDLPEGGEFRRLQYRFRQSDSGGDMEIHQFGARIRMGTTDMEN